MTLDEPVVADPARPEPLDDAQLRAAIAVANIPVLTMVLHHLTGDDRWLAEPYAPTRARGLSDHDTGGLPEPVQAEIREGDRLLFTTETNYPVITRGNPRVVDVTVVPVGGGRVPRESEIRGTVTYRQRIALGPNSEVIVRLVDSADPTGRPVAETTIPVGNRQVPIPFELPFEMRDINRQRNYELQAEIRTDGRPRFRTEAGRPVVPRAGQMLDVELLVVPASDGPEPITGRELNISRLSAGTMQIEGRGTMILFRASVVVRTSGDADVTLGRLDGSTTFSGKVIYFDSNTVRIAVTSSGNANASGEFEIRYTGRTLNSLTARDLTLDGQNVIVRF